MLASDFRIQASSWIPSNEQISQIVASPKIQAAVVTAVSGLALGSLLGWPTAVSCWTGGFITSYFWFKEMALVKNAYAMEKLLQKEVDVPDSATSVSDIEQLKNSYAEKDDSVADSMKSKEQNESCRESEGVRKAREEAQATMRKAGESTQRVIAFINQSSRNW